MALHAFENRLDKKIFLTGWYDSWDDCARTVRAQLFGILVELAENEVKEFRSDLFHDAEWLIEHVHGPITFPFMVRHSGTHIGDMVQTAIDIRSAGTVYDVALTEENGGAYYVTVARR